MIWIPVVLLAINGALRVVGLLLSDSYRAELIHKNKPASRLSLLVTAALYFYAAFVVVTQR